MSKRPNRPKESMRTDAEKYRLLQAQWMIDEYTRRHGAAPRGMEQIEEEFKDHGVVTQEEVGQTFQEYHRLRDASSLSLPDQMRLADLQKIIDPEPSRTVEVRVETMEPEPPRTIEVRVEMMPDDVPRVRTIPMKVSRHRPEPKGVVKVKMKAVKSQKNKLDRP